MANHAGAHLYSEGVLIVGRLWRRGLWGTLGTDRQGRCRWRGWDCNGCGFLDAGPFANGREAKSGGGVRIQFRPRCSEVQAEAERGSLSEPAMGCRRKKLVTVTGAAFQHFSTAQAAGPRWGPFWRALHRWPVAHLTACGRRKLARRPRGRPPAEAPSPRKSGRPLRLEPRTLDAADLPHPLAAPFAPIQVPVESQAQAQLRLCVSGAEPENKYITPSQVAARPGGGRALCCCLLSDLCPALSQS